MSFVHQLARYALAAGGSPDPHGEGTYLFYVEENKLIEKLWNEPHPVKETLVALGVRKDTAAPYLVKVGKRLVFCIDESNTLRCYENNEVDKKWNEVAYFSESNIATSPESKLSACLTPSGPAVFFQDTLGFLQGLAETDGAWKRFGPVPARPVPGTAQSLDMYKGKLRLRYMSEENYMRYQLYDYQTRKCQSRSLARFLTLKWLSIHSRVCKWQKYAPENFEFKTPVDRLIVVPNHEGISFGVFTVTNNTIVYIERNGPRHELGKFTGGIFEWIAPGAYHSDYRRYIKYGAVIY